jgi:hypothetical protein
MIVPGNHALLPKAYDASKRSAYLDRWHVGLDLEWQEWLSFIDDPQRKKKSGS